MSSDNVNEAVVQQPIRQDASRHEQEPQPRKAAIMIKRLVIRLLTAVAALLAGVTTSSTAAHAVLLPDPGAPIPGSTPAPAPQPLPAAAAASTHAMVLGMDWELALSIALFVLAAVLFVATTVQRRHATHAPAA